ncbi:MAG: cytochrome c oxidase subunit I [Dehalococcoidia bacterium]
MAVIGLPVSHRNAASFLPEWVVTTDHKRIGVMYITTNILFFIVAGIMALLMRAQLAQSESTFLGQNSYNQIFSMHGTTMLFFFIIPIGAGFGNYLLPLMIGARDMAFPRINAMSYWLIPLAGIILFSSFLTTGGAPAAGWTSYAPLSDATFMPMKGVDLWIISITLLGISSVAGSINMLATIMTMRAPGMTLSRMPVFVWSLAVTQVLILFAVPVLTAALAMLWMDRNLGTTFFDPRSGGNPVLWQHLFWFYSHPAVYIMVLPAFGVISEVLPVFTRKPLFGRKAVIYSSVAIGVLGFTVWMHHMFSTGLNLPLTLFTMLATMSIAVPTGVKMFNWMGTMWGGSISFEPPMIFAVGFLLVFLIGGIDGVYTAIVPIDYALNDTYWVVSHIHYVLFGGSVFGVFSGIYYWYPKITGRFLSKKLALTQAALMFVGMNVAFMPMHVLGLMGMPRRIATYQSGQGWDIWNLISTIGAFTVAVGILVFLVNMIVSSRGPRNAGNDPWQGNTLEWLTSSPPPVENFETIPQVRSENPAADVRRDAALAGGLPASQPAH